MAGKKEPPLPRYTLEKNEKRGGWDLKREGGERATKHFDNKADATAGGALSNALPGGVGSVRIHKEDGRSRRSEPFLEAEIRKRRRANIQQQVCSADFRSQLRLQRPLLAQIRPCPAIRLTGPETPNIPTQTKPARATLNPDIDRSCGSGRRGRR